MEKMYSCFYLGAVNKMYLYVADGVGSWRDYSIDTVEFPIALMSEIKK